MPWLQEFCSDSFRICLLVGVSLNGFKPPREMYQFGVAFSESKATRVRLAKWPSSSWNIRIYDWGPRVLFDLYVILIFYIQCLQALDALNKKDITEVKSYAKPPQKVEMVLEAVLILLQVRFIIFYLFSAYVACHTYVNTKFNST